MEMKKVLKYAMEIGECMLVSGAGVSRVEDTISRICKAYGAKEANVFSITSSIVTTIEDEKGEILTQTKRIRSYKTDFTKLDELNQLSRYMCKELPEEEEVKRKISEIKKGKVVVFTEEVLSDRSAIPSQMFQDMDLVHRQGYFLLHFLYSYLQSGKKTYNRKM